MRIYSSLDADYDPSDGCVLAVGNFDGVHKGHQQIFTSAVQSACTRGVKSVLLTFSRHPAALVRPGDVPPPLMAVPDRLAFAEKAGFDAAFVLEFDEDLAALSPEKFVERVLVDRLRVRSIIAGESWRFGQERKGDMVMLDSLGRRLGFEVKVVDPCVLKGQPVSSTRIRMALAAGDVAAACALLGRPHFVRGTVVSGKGRGRDLGFPTANLECHHTMVPAEGVYAGGYRMGADVADRGSDKGRYGPVDKAGDGPAAISIGSSPTYRNGSYAVEAYLVGWKGDLYGATVTIAFLERLREQSRFPGEVDLSRQIALDVKATTDLYDVAALENIPF